MNIVNNRDMTLFVAVYQDPNRLVNGLDYHGNLCGITNYVTPNGDDVINLPKAYPLPSGLFVCIESCPSATIFDEFVCEYEIQHEIDQTFSSAAELGASELAESKSAKNALYMFYTGQKQCLPVIESSSFLGYCIPGKPLEEVSNKLTALVMSATASDCIPKRDLKAAEPTFLLDAPICASLKSLKTLLETKLEFMKHVNNGYMSKEKFVRTVSTMYFIGSFPLYGSLIYYGFATKEDLLLSLFLIIPAFLGQQIGTRIRDKINQKQFRISILITLIILGVSLFIKTL